MISKSKKIIYNNFVYDNNNLGKTTSYKYLGIDLHHKFKWNLIKEGWKVYYRLENNCKINGPLAIW